MMRQLSDSKTPLLSTYRVIANNWIQILIIFGFFLSFFYALVVSRQVHLLIPFRRTSGTVYYVKDNLFSFNASKIMLKLSNAQLRIYEEQLSHYTTAPFLPIYQNHRLILKLTLSSIATYLYGNVNTFQGSNRDLRIICLEKRENKTEFQQSFNLTLRFNVQKINTQAVYFTWDSKTVFEHPLVISTIPAQSPSYLVTHITIHVSRIFCVTTVFSFTYQWLDSDVLNFFQWPQWPLKKSCAHSILNDLIQNHTDNLQPNFACSIARILTHTKLRQVFTNTQAAIIEWLDMQYKAMVTDSLSTKQLLNEQSSSIKRSRRLSPFEMASNRNICTAEFYSWISKYQDWHENVTLRISNPQLNFEQQRDLVVDENIRFMLYEKSGSGIADRIVHLMTTYLIAILTNRLFLLHSDWLEFSNVMLASLNYERELTIPWFTGLDQLNMHLSQNDRKYLTSANYKFSIDRLTRDYDYDLQFPERILTFEGHTGGIIRMMTSQTSIYRKFLTEELRMSPNNMFGCLFHSLFLYRLSALVEMTSIKINSKSLQQKQLGHSAQQLLQILLTPSFYPIGIQIRTGDWTMRADNLADWLPFSARKDSLLESFQYFFTCAYDIVNGNQTFLADSKQVPIIFLISDTTRLRQAALSRWKLPSSCLQWSLHDCQSQAQVLPVVASSDPVFHVTYTSQSWLAVRLAMFDIFLFGLCEQHVITVTSGFGRIAVFSSLRQRNIYTLLTDKKGSCLGKHREATLVGSSFQWSGIR